MTGHHDPAPTPRVNTGGGTPASLCTGYGDGAVDQNGQSVDIWMPGIRSACGYPGYENGDNPMPAGTPFPPPRPFRSIDATEPVFGFKVYYLGADTATPCDDLRIIFHQGNAPGGHTVRYHSMQYSIAHCSGGVNGTYLGYTDVAAFADTGGLEDVNPNQPGGDDGKRPMKLIPTLADVEQNAQVFEVWYVDFFIFDPRLSTLAQPTNRSSPILTTRPGFDVNNVATYQVALNDTSLHFTCGVLSSGTLPGDPKCQYDAARRGLQHPAIDIYPGGQTQNALPDFCTDLYGGFDKTPGVIKGVCPTGNQADVIHQHVFPGSLYRTVCSADSGVPGHDPPDCYPEFVRGPNSPTANQSSSPYESPGPATYALPGLSYPN